MQNSCFSQIGVLSLSKFCQQMRHIKYSILHTLDSRTPRAAAYALQDTANLGLFAPPPISRPVRKLPSVRHTPGPAAMLTKSPKFTYRLAGHTLPLGAVVLRRKYKCGRAFLFPIASQNGNSSALKWSRNYCFSPISYRRKASSRRKPKNFRFLTHRLSYSAPAGPLCPADGR